VLVGPTARDLEGLALSSRNRYLTDPDRRQALRLSMALRTATELLRKGQRVVSILEQAMASELSPLRVDYAEVRALPDLSHPVRASGRVLVAVAAHVGRARLIDNVCLQVDDLSVTQAPLWDPVDDIPGCNLPNDPPAAARRRGAAGKESR
jgi:pantoate--beta-alanine ligase